MRDLHQAIRYEPMGNAVAPLSNTHLYLVRNHWGKSDNKLALHARPSQFTTSGIQITDFLAAIGFKRGPCSLTGTGECYGRFVSDDFGIAPFVEVFDQALNSFRQAAAQLESCGIFIDQAEGWGYFFGKTSVACPERDFSSIGDGHSAVGRQLQKSSEDDVFQYRLVWLTGAAGVKGWVTHYRPKDQQLSVELRAVFSS